jgi:alcohol dehydrogenase class IV
VKFEFATATRIIYERGGLSRIGALVAPFGHRVLVVRGGEHLDRSGAIPRLESSLAGSGVFPTYVTVRAEPTVTLVDGLVAQAREAACEAVIGLGGGSVLDAAKAVAGLLALGGQALDYLEVVGRGQPITRPAAPLIAAPTTAGTGTEVTRNAVLTCEAQGVKASMRSSQLIPRVALIDPSLTHSVPASVTASTGLDALTQLIEPYVCTRAQPLTDALALPGIRLVAGSLRRAFDNGQDEAARDDLALAALLSGMCLANSGLGAVHGFAAPLGAALPVPHGVACAALLPHVMAANVAALRAQQPEGPALRRYGEVAQALLGPRRVDLGQAIDEAIEQLAALVQELGVPRLGQYGLTEQGIPSLVARAKQASSMRANPAPLSDAALAECLRRAL